MPARGALAAARVVGGLPHFVRMRRVAPRCWRVLQRAAAVVPPTAVVVGQQQRPPWACCGTLRGSSGGGDRREGGGGVEAGSVSSVGVCLEGYARLPNAGLPTLLEAQELVDLLHEARGEELSSVELGSNTQGARELLLATARSEFHLKMLAQAVAYKLKERAQALQPYGEGRGRGAELVPLVSRRQAETDWRVVDCGSIVVHLMTAQKREELALEELWSEGDATRVRHYQPPERVTAARPILPR